MDTYSFILTDVACIQAAPDTQLSSSETHLLATLLKEEDRHDYNQLLQIQLSNNILHILHQLCSLLHLSSSATWMATILIKKLIIQLHSIDLLSIIACVTLSSKYQDSSPQVIDYELLTHSYHLKNIQQIHDNELHLLNIFSYDLCVTTPDHFFSYLSNLNIDDNNIKQIIQQARSSLSINSLSHQTLGLLHNYPSSIVALSLIYNITSNTFIIQQIKNFLLHKKDRTHYLRQLLHCTVQLQSGTS